MEPPRRVAEHYVHPPGLGGLKGVEEHRAGVRPLVLADQVRLGPLGPDFQLVCRRRPEGVRRAEEALLPAVAQEVRHLADGGGFPHAVDPDEEEDAGGGGDVHLRGAHIQRVHDDRPQGGADLLLAHELFLPDLLPELLHSLHGDFHAEVGED